MTKLRFEEKQVGEMWLITSPDVPGLYVSHRELETARRDIWPTIQAMDKVRQKNAERVAVMHKAVFAA